MTSRSAIAMVRISRRLGAAYKTKFFFLEESHDSFLALCHQSIIQKTAIIIKEELEKPIDCRKCTLARDYDLVIPCDIQIGRRWIAKSKDWPDGMEKYREEAWVG